MPAEWFCYCSCSKYQQRLSYDLLSSLARVLLDGTVFEIISSLREVQQLEERNLSNQRIKLVNEHKCKMVFFLCFILNEQAIACAIEYSIISLLFVGHSAWYWTAPAPASQQEAAVLYQQIWRSTVNIYVFYIFILFRAHCLYDDCDC